MLAALEGYKEVTEVLMAHEANIHATNNVSNKFSTITERYYYILKWL